METQAGVLADGSPLSLVLLCDFHNSAAAKLIVDAYMLHHWVFIRCSRRKVLRCSHDQSARNHCRRPCHIAHHFSNRGDARRDRRRNRRNGCGQRCDRRRARGCPRGRRFFAFGFLRAPSDRGRRDFASRPSWRGRGNLRRAAALGTSVVNVVVDDRALPQLVDSRSLSLAGRRRGFRASNWHVRGGLSSHGRTFISCGNDRISCSSSSFSDAVGSSNRSAVTCEAIDE